MRTLQDKVSDESKRLATRCRHNLRCLDGEGRNHCAIAAEIGIFLEVNECRCCGNGQCDYKIPYGFGNYCSCPVMRELYRQHKMASGAAGAG